MFTEQDVLVDRQRRHDMMATADRYRLIRMALDARKRHPSRYERWLAQLGARMIEWGSRLEARYTPPPVCCSPAAD
jgi:hypothetical protein